jgi:hypothetical protein
MGTLWSVNDALMSFLKVLPSIIIKSKSWQGICDALEAFDNSPIIFHFNKFIFCLGLISVL